MKEQKQNVNIYIGVRDIEKILIAPFFWTHCILYNSFENLGKN